MNTVVSIFLQSIGLVICLFCGWLMWRYRRQVPDHSRLILAVCCFTAAMAFAGRLVHYATNNSITPYYYVLSPLQLCVGLFMLTFYITYPLEVMHPRRIKFLPPNRFTWLLFAPFLLSLVPPLCGLRFQEVATFSDSLHHISDIDVILRLFMANLLRQNPTQIQKQLFFAAGFRSYPTAHRNFVKFKGCSPTEYIEKLG